MLLPLQGVKRDMVAYPGCRSLRSLCPGLSANPPSSGLIGLSARSHQRSVRLRRDVVPARRYVTPASRLVTPARRFVTYRPRDGKFTARGTACLPPEGRHVYRPTGGK